MQPRKPDSNGTVIAPQLYDFETAAERLSVTPRMIRELWAQRKLSGSRVGKHVRFSDADLVDYLERHRVEALR
jgi:excisionase family DNA binding protein